MREIDDIKRDMAALAEDPRHPEPGGVSPATRPAPLARPAGDPGPVLAASQDPDNMANNSDGPDKGAWRRLVADTRARKQAAHAGTSGTARVWQEAGQGLQAGSPSPLGPVIRMAIARGSSPAFAASARGGVFRSDDAGASWRAMMDRFDTDPMNCATAGLVCGAIAIDQENPQRVYAGTGNGDAWIAPGARTPPAIVAPRGIGPLRSDDGGASWVMEPSLPELTGEAFFAMAADPLDRDLVLGATTAGLYRRVPDAGGFVWRRVLEGVVADVVVAARGGKSRFYCATWDRDGQSSAVMHSDDGGATWRPSGRDYPFEDTGRIALAIRPDDPDLVHALAARAADGGLLGLFRLARPRGTWVTVERVPEILPLDHGRGRGERELAIAVDPADPDLIFLGGSSVAGPARSGTVWRCRLRTKGWRVHVAAAMPAGVPAGIGVHALVHAPGQGDSPWCAFDGGVLTDCAPRAARDEAVADNTGDNQSNPGAPGARPWHIAGNFRWQVTVQPIAAPGQDAAHILAAGAGPSVYLSDDAGANWPAASSFTLPDPQKSGLVTALAFATPGLLFIGTSIGRVFRADRGGDGWRIARLDNDAAFAPGATSRIASIAVDWADPTHESIYVALHDRHGPQRIRHFDGASWQARSGQEGAHLLDMDHGFLVVDPTAPANIYAGTEIGVWHSADGGQAWHPFGSGLPDVPVLDLMLDPARRVLRATTDGRGIFTVSVL